MAQVPSCDAGSLHPGPALRDQLLRIEITRTDRPYESIIIREEGVLKHNNLKVLLPCNLFE